MNITLGISSGIAAFKVIDLITPLKEKGHSVQVIMTKNAAHMVDPKEIEKLTGNTVFCDLFPPNFNYKDILKKRIVDHIEIAKQTELFIIAPMTANLLGKIAHGLANDFLTTTLLATKSQVLLCPSMNTEMWYHPAVQKNINTVQQYGYLILEPTSGQLACGTEGIGRLPEPSEILKTIEMMIQTKNSLHGKKILVTAGGTQEPIDEVRVITNHSSGKMGVAIAEECYQRGAEVLLIRAENAVKSNLPIPQITFNTADSLATLLKKHTPQYEALFHTAAVSDFSLKKQSGKMESSKKVTIQLTPQPKIISQVKKWNPHILLIGFKAVYGITPVTIEKTKQKLKESNAISFIMNDISRTDIGFGSDLNEALVMLSDGTIHEIKKTSKKNLAHLLISYLIDHEIFH